LYIFVDREEVLQIRKTGTSLKQSVKKASKWRQKNKVFTYHNFANQLFKFKKNLFPTNADG